VVEAQGAHALGHGGRRRGGDRAMIVQQGGQPRRNTKKGLEERITEEGHDWSRCTVENKNRRTRWPARGADVQQTPWT